MIATIIIVGLAFIWLGYETDWMRVRLPRGKAMPQKSVPLARLWFKTFQFYHPFRNPLFFPKEYPAFVPEIKGYTIKPTFQRYNLKWEGLYVIYLSPGIRDLLCGREWLDKHWADLKDYQPKVELYYGNGYKQTFTLKKPELMGKIIKINTGKKYFQELARQLA